MIHAAFGSARGMSFLDNVERIRAELLGADRDTPAAQVVAAALPLTHAVCGLWVCVVMWSWWCPLRSPGHILSLSGAKILPTFLMLGILNAGPRV